MALKECNDWEEIDYIEATCPHCNVIDTYFGLGYTPGTKIICSNEKCKKRFKLGEQK